MSGEDLIFWGLIQQRLKKRGIFVWSDSCSTPHIPFYYTVLIKLALIGTILCLYTQMALLGS